LFPKGATACSVADRPVISVFMGPKPQRHKSLRSSLTSLERPFRKPIVYYPLSSPVAALAAAKVIEWTLMAGWNGTVVQSSAAAATALSSAGMSRTRALASSSFLWLITVISVVPLSHDVQSRLNLLF